MDTLHILHSNKVLRPPLDLLVISVCSKLSKTLESLVSKNEAPNDKEGFLFEVEIQLRGV